MDELTVFCRNIRFLRLKNSCSMTKMSKTIGVSVNTLRSLEAGHIPKNLSSAVVFRTAVHFGIRASSLFIPLSPDNP